MATINYFIGGTKRKSVPIYVRLIAGHKKMFIAPSGFSIDPKTWSNKTQALKQRITTKADDKLTDKRAELKKLLNTEVLNYAGEYSKQWLMDVIYKFHHKTPADAKSLNEFITKFISDIEAGKVKNKSGRNITTGTARNLKGFQRIFNEYQGVYTDKRIKELTKEGKPLRQPQAIDFEDVTFDFYNSFKNFLTDEGYKLNTVGRFIKQLKYFMSKSLAEKKHSNREFKESAFTSMTEEVFTVSLTPEELDKIYNYDLSHDKRMETARDKFIVLCETALRVSDYDKIDVNIRTVNGTPLIFLYQTKTADPVIIPLTERMEEVLAKYDGKLPRIHEVYVNKYIKSIAYQCGITEQLRWEATKYGKRYPKVEYKWKLISCHTGRRSAASNMYRSGIPTLDIMRLTGHKTEKEFLKYIRLSNEEVALKMAQHPYFSQLRVAR